MLAVAASASNEAHIGPLSEELSRRFDQPGPRYTSYPTADRFNAGFGPDDATAALTRLSLSTVAAPLSVYVHIPFCESLCYYCGCNKVITKHHERATEYSTCWNPRCRWWHNGSAGTVPSGSSTSAAVRPPSCRMTS